MNDIDDIYSPPPEKRGPSPKRIVEVAPPPVNERPICPGCGERLRPWMWTVEYGSLRGERPSRVKWDGGYHAYGAFCTLRCATDYANAVYKKTGIRYRRVS